MRVNNAIREKIDTVLNKKLEAQIKELYAEKNAYEKSIKVEFDKLAEEANAKAQAILAKYPGLYFTHYGNRDINYFYDRAFLNFPQNAELNHKAQELREKKRELAVDLEIRCALEKDADKFFQMLAEAEF